MSHVRTRLRARVQTDIRNGTALVADDKVYTGRKFPTSAIPCVAIYDRSERIAQEDEELEALNAPVAYSRLLDLAIEIRAGSDDDVDAIAVDIEVAMAGDRTLNGLAVNHNLISSTKQDIAGQTPVVIASLVYRVWYRTTALDPENPI